jgi:hypothetical protein
MRLLQAQLGRRNSSAEHSFHQIGVKRGLNGHLSRFLIYGKGDSLFGESARSSESQWRNWPRS